MQGFEGLAEALGLKAVASLFTGFAGAVLSLRFLNVAGPWGNLCMAAGGFVTAIFVTPLVLSWASVGKAGEAGIAFLVGLYGMSLIGESYKIIASGQVRAFAESFIRRNP